jgi:drug/metabolite transporter (DMT)-like permease
MKSEASRGFAFAIFAGVIFGTAALFTRSISGISSVAISAGRLTLGSLCMAFLIGSHGRVQEVRQSFITHRATLVFLGFLSSFHFLLFVLAVQKTLIANALILVNTAPILVLLLTPLILKETITPLDVVGVVVTFLGAGLIVGFDVMGFRPEHVVGDICALASALCCAVYVIVARKLRRIYSSPVIMGWFFGLGALFLWIGGLLFKDQFFMAPSPSSWLFLVLLGILPTGIGHFCYNVSLKYISAARASTIILLEPVSGTLLAWIFFHEVPPIMSGLGILIVLIGVSMTSLIGARSS